MSTVTIEQMGEKLRTAQVGRVGLLLYFATLLAEVPGVVARILIVSAFYGLLWLLTQVVVALSLLSQGLEFEWESFVLLSPEMAPGAFGGITVLLSAVSSTQGPVLFLVAVFPILASLATFVLPGGFFLRRFALGARPLSQQERERFERVRDALNDGDNPPKWPTHVYALDKPNLESYAIGSTLYLTRSLLYSDHLDSQVAHALAHFNSRDSQLVLALRRLVLPPVYLFSRAVGQSAPGVYRVTGAVSDSGVGLLAAGAVWLCSLLMAIAGGGLGLWIFNLGWVWYWQQREYAADAYAAKLGQGGNLDRFLDERLGGTLTSFDIAAPYLMIEPPSTELRIDRLKYPENYESADTFDARPMLAVLAVVVAVFWLFPMTTSAFSRMAYDVSGSWQLTSFCRVQGCEPSEPYNDVPVEVYFDDGMVDAQVVQGTLVYERSGTYTYIASDRVLLSTRSVTAFPLTFNGDYRIKRTGNTLILYGGGESLKFERQ